MGWRERDWARFTDAEFDAIYGRSPRPVSAQHRTWAPPRSRTLLAPGAGLAVVVSAVVLLAGQFPRTHPLLPALRIGTPSQSSTQRQFPLNLPTSAPYGSTLTVNGADNGAASGEVVAVGRWNGGPPTTLATTALAADRSWSLPIPMSQQGTLAVTIELPSGSTLVGSVLVQP